MSLTFRVACAGLLILCACYYYLAPGPGRNRVASRPAIDPITEKKLEIFAAARERSADPDLEVLYTDINQRHFGGELPAIPVMWDDALKEVDSLVGDNYHLQGMTNGSLMLVSPELRSDDAELRRTMCHEAVHVKLHPVAGTKANHGDLFQEELRRLFEEGCFVAILASDAEKTALRQRIDEQTARLKQEGAQLDLTRTRLDGERAEIERAVADLNARILAANTQRSGWPTDEEQEALRTRRARAIEESSDFNASFERHAAESAELNRDIDRYRLMVAYPHGIDEEAMVPHAGSIQDLREPSPRLLTPYRVTAAGRVAGGTHGSLGHAHGTDDGADGIDRRRRIGAGEEGRSARAGTTCGSRQDGGLPGRREIRPGRRAERGGNRRNRRRVRCRGGHGLGRERVWQ